MIFAYIRVSSKDQNLDRQVEAFDGVKIDELFQEKISGKDNNRPELNRMLAKLREGDVVVAKSMDRLARSFKGLMEIWEQIEKTGATLRILDMNLTFDRQPMTQFLVQVMAAVSELERGMIRQRQKEGIALAVAKGSYKGRRPNTEKHEQIAKLRNAGMTADEIAAAIGVNRRTVFRVLKATRID